MATITPPCAGGCAGPRWRRQRCDRSLSMDRRVNEGWCACCRAETRFEETGVWLRDQYLCVRCQSIPRFRAINLTLDKYFPGWEQLELHESSPCNDFIRRYNTHYSSSYFFEDVPLGSEERGTRCENLERLTYPDNTFDLFVTQDVLEHVFNPDRAVAEIMRVVKPGGAHVFTAPKHKGLRLTAPRAALEQGEIRYLLDPRVSRQPDRRRPGARDVGLWRRFRSLPVGMVRLSDRHLRDPRPLARARRRVPRSVRDQEGLAATPSSADLTPGVPWPTCGAPVTARPGDRSSPAPLDS